MNGIEWSLTDVIYSKLLLSFAYDMGECECEWKWQRNSPSLIISRQRRIQRAIDIHNNDTSSFL